MGKHTPHEATIAKLIEQGLIDSEHNITDKGHEHVRALIARCNTHRKKDAYLAREP